MFDTDCRTLILKNDDGGGGRASRIEWTATGYGSVHVRASQADATHGPDRGYELRLIGDTSACGTWAEGPTGTDREIIQSIEQVSDGGFLATGALLGVGQPQTDFLMRLDAAGHPLWKKKYGAPGIASIANAREDSDGGIVLTGYLEGTSAGLWVAKLDGKGEPVWQKTYGIGGSGRVIEPMAGGGYGVLSTSGGLVVMRLDPAGNVLWTRRLADFVGTALDETDDEGFVVSGWRSVPGNPDRIAAIFKLDADGGLDWVRGLGAYPEFRQYAQSVRETAEGGYVVAGWTWDFWSVGGGNSGDWVLKLDPWGRREWSTFFLGGAGGEAASWNVRQAPDGGYALSDTRGGFGLSRLDRSGDVSWVRRYDRSGVSEYAIALCATADGGFALAGGVSGSGTTSYWLIRADASGQVQAPCPYVLDVPHGTASDEVGSWPSGVTMTSMTPTVTSVSALPLPIAASLTQQCGLPKPDEVSPPGAAQPLAFVDTGKLAWEGAAMSGSDSFNLYRGEVGGLHLPDYGSCLEHTLFSSSTSDISTPAIGACWTYLVTGRNAAGEGTMGVTSAGAERPNIAPCP